MRTSKNIDYKIVVPTLAVILAIVVGLMWQPDLAKAMIQRLYDGIVGRFGWMYMLACIASFLLLGYITVTGYGDFRLGGEEAEPAYSEFAWGSMLFTSGVGSSAVILGLMEPIYYLTEPPFGLEPFSQEAYEYAHMYGQFHWGPSAWAFYIPAIVVVALIVYEKQDPSLRLGVVSKYLGKSRLGRASGKLLDILVQLGILASISTSIGLAVPAVSILISRFLGIPDDLMLKVLVLGVWIAIFTFSVFRGLDKGIRVLSNINVVLLAVFAGIILIFSGVNDIFKMEVNSVGLYFQQFLRLNTWLDPFGSGDFQKMWTIFYWGWWLAFMPMMALFIVRISKGRTLKQVIWMQLVWGSLGCWACFMIFGGYSLKLQNTGALDLAGTLASEGQNAAILQIIRNMPGAPVMMFFFCVLIFIFLATTIDSAAYVLASGSVRNLRINEQPSRGMRIFWAAALAVLSIALLAINELKAVQTLSLIAGFPLIFVQFYFCWASIKLLRDRRKRIGIFHQDSGKSKD